MKLIRCIIIMISITITFLIGQNKTSDKNKLQFSNIENSHDYLEMLERAFYKVRETYVDSINESERSSLGICLANN